MPQKHEYKSSEQKLGRNSASNILRLFTKLLRSPQFKHRYQSVKERFKLELTFKDFNSWTTGIGLNMNKYVRIKKVLNGIRTKPQLGRILSIMYSIFECEFARTAALTSSKT